MDKYIRIVRQSISQSLIGRTHYIQIVAVMLFLFGLLLTSSCGSLPRTRPAGVERASDFHDFRIQRSRLGKIEIGMTIEEAEKHLSGFTKEAHDAVAFGFGGGSPAYLYSREGEIVLGLIPKLDTDSLLFIIAAHEKLRTTNGLNPKSTVSELTQKYPDFAVWYDEMNEWEYFQDEDNGWDFIFMTDKDTEIGEYMGFDKPAKPKNLGVKTDWITIR